MRSLVVTVMAMGLLGGLLGASALEEASAKPGKPAAAPPKPKVVPSIVGAKPLRILDDALLQCFHKTDCKIRGKVGDGRRMLVSLVGTDGKQRVGLTQTWKPGEVTFRVPNNAPFGDYDLTIVDEAMKPLSNPVRMFLARTAAEIVANCSANADADGDGNDREECGGDDCDDGDPRRYRGGIEICDEENLDEDCDPNTFGLRDSDRDGFFDAACCNPGGCGDDCNDHRRTQNPNSPEVCNLIDDNCDGYVDEQVMLTAYKDDDKDLYGNPSSSERVCPHLVKSGWVTNNYDCDDKNVAKNPRGGC